MTNDEMVCILSAILKSKLNQNEKLILSGLCVFGDQTQLELLQVLNLNKSCINKCIESLSSKGLIGSELFETKCGRPVTKWMINPLEGNSYDM